MPNFGGSQFFASPNFAIRILLRDAARAFGEQRVFAAQFHAAGEAVVRLALFADAHVAGGDAAHLAILAVDHFGGREARIDFDAERLRFRGEPFAQTGRASR